jgi:hypothetical protein
MKSLKTIRDTCIDFFKNEEIKKDVKEMVRPIIDMVCDECYWYVWVICIYNVFFMLVVLANLYLLLKLTSYPAYMPYSPRVVWT